MAREDEGHPYHEVLQEQSQHLTNKITPTHNSLCPSLSLSHPESKYVSKIFPLVLTDKNHNKEPY